MIINNFNFITDIIDKGNSSIIVLTGEQLSGKSVLLDKIKAYYKGKKVICGQAQNYLNEHARNLIDYDIMIIDDFQYFEKRTTSQKVFGEIIIKREKPTVIFVSKEGLAKNRFITEIDKILDNAIKFEIVDENKCIDIKGI